MAVYLREKTGNDAPPPRFRMLYAGRDLDLKNTLQDKLNRASWLIVYCPCGLSASTFIRSNIPYNLFLFDQDLPAVDALELAHLARSLSHRQHIPIIVLSLKPQAERARRAGTTVLLKNRKYLPELLDTIRRLIAPSEPL